MKILHVITGLRKAAGTTVFVCEIAKEQARLGHVVHIVHQEVWRKEIYPVDSHVVLIGKHDFFQTLQGRDYDVVHIHGMWEYMLHKFAAVCRHKRWPYIWSPHGSLAPWAMKFNRWKKRPVWWLWQRNDLNGAAMFHATALCEQDWILSLGFNQPCVIAPLGVEIKGLDSSLIHGKRILCESGRKRKMVAKYIGRVSPYKGLSDLLWAFDFDGWTLRIVGPDQNGHVAELKQLAAKLGICDSVEFAGPKFGDDLVEEYASADLFILPTHSENFGSVVIESLAQGVPVICTKGAPWKELEEYGCGWWTDIGVEPIRAALRSAISLSEEERNEMGRRGRRLVEEKYTWPAVCGRLMTGYDSVIYQEAAK